MVLALAALKEHYGIMSLLVNEFGCNYNDGIALVRAIEQGNLTMAKFLIDHGAMVDLHAVCKHGDLKMFKMVIDHKAYHSVNDKNVDGYTPFQLAVKKGNHELAAALLNAEDLKCNLTLSGVEDQILYCCLTAAIENGWLKSVHKLLKCYGGDLNAVHESEDCETLLMTAVKCDQCEIVKSLVNDYGCDVNIRGRGGRSLLHLAATECSDELPRLLINECGMSPLLCDEEGDTPLHLCSKLGYSSNVSFLLYEFHSSVFLRNRAGKTPSEIISSANYDEVNKIFTAYMSERQDVFEKDYQLMLRIAAAKYSGSHYVTRVFVVGHPGAGKSSLVEALKREGFIQSFNRVSNKSVGLHTAGIVPSIHTSDSYGRVQFYDFAGDPEYYSSHAAILEKLFLSDIGNNICIIVLNLQDEDAELERNYFYWSAFINHNTMNLQHAPSVIVTASHADLLSKEKLKNKAEFLTSCLNDQVSLLLDCCGPRSKSVILTREVIENISKSLSPYTLSYEASILLGLLERDFKEVTTCTARTIVHHIDKVKLLRLPRYISGLYPILKQLQAIGSLLILGGKEEDCYLVLNVSQLTNEVHKRLFSEEAFSNKPDIASFNIGLLPQSLIQEVLPPYITKECLTQLQYCQEISHVEIGQDYSISPSSEGTEVSSASPDKSLLFFPALCKLDRSNVSWLIPPDGSYSIGWLARCTNPHDYFPPRFLHVLLLRVSLRFTLVAPTNLHPSQDTPPDHVPLKRRCKMWKTGVHWLTEEGVECEVDVDISKQVVVSIRSEEHSKEALTIFNSIISCVMEAKAEFCHSIQLKHFLLDTLGCLSDDNLFQIEEVESVLEEGKNKVLSVRGDTWMSSSKLLHVRCTFWDSLFPLDEHSVLQYIEALVDEWRQLGLNLELPYSTITAIERDFPNDVMKQKLEMVTTWLSSSHSHPPCWWSLVEALQEMGENASAAAIIKDKGTAIVTICGNLYSAALSL